MTKSCLLKELDDVLDALSEELEACGFFDEVVIEEDEGEDAVVVNCLKIMLPELGLEFREGYCGRFIEDEGYYRPEYSITALYEENAAPEEYLLWTKDVPLAALYHFTHKTMEELEQLECILSWESEEDEV